MMYRPLSSRRLPRTDTHCSQARKVSMMELQVSSLEQEVDILKAQLKALKDRLDATADISEACYYAPDMPGYLETCANFEKLTDNSYL